MLQCCVVLALASGCNADEPGDGDPPDDADAQIQDDVDDGDVGGLDVEDDTDTMADAGDVGDDTDGGTGGGLQLTGGFAPGGMQMSSGFTLSGGLLAPKSHSEASSASFTLELTQPTSQGGTP
jgi:hypothetical protein